MRKLITLITLLALVACTTSDYEGYSDNTTNEESTQSISFTPSTGALTRSEGATAAAELDYKFQLYGTKSYDSDETNVQNVFAQSEYSTDGIDGDDTYTVWYNGASQTTSTNAKGWEYVGTASNSITLPDESTLTLDNDQTIKYWDYAANHYTFIAYSNNGSATVSNITNDGFTVSGSDLGNFYVADRFITSGYNTSPTSSNAASGTSIGDNIQLTFRPLSTQVRLGVYETIPGYYVRNLTFTPSSSTTSTTNALVSAYIGGESSEYKVTYDENNKAQLSTSTAESSSTFDFGAINTSTTSTTDVTAAYSDAATTDSELGIGTTAATAVWAPTPSSDGTATYTGAMPQSGDGPMTLTLDYELYKPQTGEKIQVQNATAVVPASYMEWQTGTSYTYLFKITDATNGTTGTEETSLAGLYPIVFDAVMTKDEQGITSSLYTPTIILYQANTVYENGIFYIKNTNSDTRDSVFVTVSINGTLQKLNLDQTNETATGTPITEEEYANGYNIKLWRFTGSNSANANVFLRVNESNLAEYYEGTTTLFEKLIEIGKADTSTTINGLSIQGITDSKDDGVLNYLEIPSVDHTTTSVYLPTGYYGAMYTSSAGTFILEFAYDVNGVLTKAYKLFRVYNYESNAPIDEQ